MDSYTRSFNASSISEHFSLFILSENNLYHMIMYISSITPLMFCSLYELYSLTPCANTHGRNFDIIVIGIFFPSLLVALTGVKQALSSSSMIPDTTIRIFPGTASSDDNITSPYLVHISNKIGKVSFDNSLATLQVNFIMEL